MESFDFPEFIASVKSTLTEKYIKFDGRASRKEFWYFVLAIVPPYLILGFILSFIPFGGFLLLLVMLAILPASLAVAFRRMQDKDLPGWWCFIPVYNIYLAATPGTAGPNRFGPEPAIVS